MLTQKTCGDIQQDPSQSSPNTENLCCAFSVLFFEKEKEHFLDLFIETIQQQFLRTNLFPIEQL